MSTLNTDYFTEENKRLVAIINDFGELLIREDFKAYQEIVLVYIKDKSPSEEEERDFLLKLYHIMIDKFRIIDFNVLTKKDGANY